MTENQALEKVEERLRNIEVAITELAVQNEKIVNIQSQVSKLWEKIDDVKTWQAGCPREVIKEALNRQWVVIGLLATIVTGTLLKALGVL